MNDIDNSISAFEKLINKLSIEKFGTIVAKIDAEGISGPSVDEYFAKLNDSIGAFFSDSETYTFNDILLKPINNLYSIESAEKVTIDNYIFSNLVSLMAQPYEDISQFISFNSAGQNVNSLNNLEEILKTSGEPNYTMAA